MFVELDRLIRLAVILNVAAKNGESTKSALGAAYGREGGREGGRE